MHRHPGSPYVPVCGAHHSYGYSTFDIPARPRLRLPPLCVQATGYHFQGCRCLHSQQSIHHGDKGGEVPALLEECLQLHPLLPPLRLMQALFRCFPLMGIGVSVHDIHVVNTVGPVLPEVTDQEVSLLFRGLWRRRAVLVS